MSLAGTFINESKPVIKRLYVANEDDYEFLQRCFPEPGFMTYLNGLVIKRFVETLKQHGINNATDRLQHPEFAPFTGILSHYNLIGKASGGHVGRRTGEARGGTPKHKRVPSELAKAYQQIERDQKEVRS